MTTSGLTGKPLTLPSATLSPSDGERDGVRGVWSIPPLVFGNWSELPPGRAGRRAVAPPRLPRGQAFLTTPARLLPGIASTAGLGMGKGISPFGLLRCEARWV